MHYANDRQFSIPKLTKNRVEWIIAQELKGDITSFTFKQIDEAPTLWKHACFKGGVQPKRPIMLTYPTGERISFIYCQVCRSITYCIER